jgi:hypothetical protein
MATVRAVRTTQHNNISRKNMKTATSISGNRPFLGPANFLRDASDLLIAVLFFYHSRTLLSSTPKIAAAMRFPFSSVHLITSFQFSK